MKGLVEELPRLLGYCRRLCRSDDEARELVQRTALRALQNTHLFDGANVGAWLTTIARNIWNSEVRSRLRKRRLLEQWGVPLQVGEAQLDSAAVDVGKLLAQLPEERRQVVQLVDMEEQDYLEAARRLGVPVGTIMSRRHRAVRQMASEVL